MKNEIILYQQDETAEHINNCFKEGELEKLATVKDSLTVQKEGQRKVSRKIEYYNLDVIIAIQTF